MILETKHGQESGIQKATANTGYVKIQTQGKVTGYEPGVAENTTKGINCVLLLTTHFSFWESPYFKRRGKEAASMAYCFMHTEKIKSFSNMGARYRHNYRTVEVKNADKSLMDQNHEVIPLPSNENGEQMSYKQAWEQRIKELDYYKTHSVRKNAVLAYEIVTTFSRGRINEVNVEDWKKQNAEWLKKTFDVAPDGKSNVLSMVYHGDEAGNVHCHALVMPIDEQGKLNARRFTGKPSQLTEMQSSYARDMERFGLERGIQNSRAKHTDIKRFYAALNKNIEAPAIKQGERFGDYIERTKDYFKTQMAAAYKKELDERRKGQETLARQRNMEQEAIKKELDATQRLAYETMRELHDSSTKLKQKRADIEYEIELLQKKRNSLRGDIHDAEFDLQVLKDSSWKSQEYDRIQENLELLRGESPELAERVEELLMPEIEIEVTEE